MNSALKENSALNTVCTVCPLHRAGESAREEKEEDGGRSVQESGREKASAATAERGSGANSDSRRGTVGKREGGNVPPPRPDVLIRRGSQRSDPVAGMVDR